MHEIAPAVHLDVTTIAPLPFQLNAVSNHHLLSHHLSTSLSVVLVSQPPPVCLNAGSVLEHVQAE